MPSGRWALSLYQIGMAAVCLLLAISIGGCRRGSRRSPVEPPADAQSELQSDQWKTAVHRVEEERGEPMGRKASVEIPGELRQYRDRHRFLATQVAEARSRHLDLPQDYADLVDLIRAGKIVEMPRIGDDYILYGVGENATDLPFMHYDRASAQSVPIYATDDEFRSEDARLRDSLAEPRAQLAGLESELKRTARRDKSRRHVLTQEIDRTRNLAGEIARRQQLLESFYLEPRRRIQISADYQRIADLASDLGGKVYDIANPVERRELKVRLLSFIRPAARDVLLEIARAYKEKFDRPLPVTSLIRPEQYQQQLSETNPNATKIAIPPHATGLAFDLYYFYMSAAEQDYLMERIAELKRAGRIEALRENRDNIHVFAFANGIPPDEKLIADAIHHPAAIANAERAVGQVAR